MNKRAMREISNRIEESIAFKNMLGIADEPEPGTADYDLLVRFTDIVKRKGLNILAETGTPEHQMILECLHIVRNGHVTHPLSDVHFVQWPIEDYVCWAQQVPRTSAYCKMPCPIDQKELDRFIHTHNRTLDYGMDFLSSFLGTGKEHPEGLWDIAEMSNGRSRRLCVVLKPYFSSHPNSYPLAPGEWFLFEEGMADVLYGANLIELFAHMRRLNFRDACSQIAESFGKIRDTTKKYWMKSGWSQVNNTISPVLPKRVAIQIDGKMFGEKPGGLLGEFYQYESPQRMPIGVVHYHPNGDAPFRLEQTLWVKNNSQEHQWELRPFIQDLPLYAAPLIHLYPSATVVIVENERACRARQAIPLNGIYDEILTTWPRGYASLENVSFQILHGRNVQCHIGKDDEAYLFAKKIFKKLTQAGVGNVFFVLNEEMTLERFNRPLPDPITFDELGERFNSSVDKVDRREPRPASGTSITELANLSGEKFAIPFVLEPIIEEGDAVMLLAKPDTGKSWLALLIGLTMANGGDFGKLLSAPKPKSVLYVYGERRRKLARQAKFVVTKIGIADHAAEMVFFPSLDGGKAEPLLDISTEEGQGAVTKVATSADVVIFDTIGSLTAKKVDHPDGWKKTEAFFADLTAQGKTIIFLHHTSSTDSQEPRGTQWMKAYVDTIMLMESCGEDSAIIHFTQKHTENPRQLEAMNSTWSLNWEREGDDISWDLQLKNEEFAKDKKNVDSKPSLVTKTLHRRKRLVELQRLDGGVSLEKVANEFGCSTDTIYRDIRKLKKEGWQGAPTFVVEILSSKS